MGGLQLRVSGAGVCVVALCAETYEPGDIGGTQLSTVSFSNWSINMHVWWGISLKQHDSRENAGIRRTFVEKVKETFSTS